MKHMCNRLTISPSLTLEEAWGMLEEANIEILWGCEEEGEIELFITLLCPPETLASFDWIILCEPFPLPPIDWEAQWAAHGINYQEGRIHLDPAAYGRTGKTLQLQPGSGFGDLSHPTTRIMMTLLARYLQHPLIIDIGCGSGILALSAVAMGAPRAFGIDIDQGAIEHSIQNAHLNQLEKQCFFSTPSSFSWNVTSEPLLILMNMIHTEQEIAWHSLPALHDQPGELLTSGVRIEERGVYLDQMTRRGWALIDEREEEGWLGFYFCRSEKIPSLFN